jgi:hypothetical protein
MSRGVETSPLTIILLVDALGWEVTQRFGFCRDVFSRSSPLDTVLGYSSAAIPSLLTGALPVEHGAWAMYRYAPERSPFRWFRRMPRLPHAAQWRLRSLTRRFIERRRMIQGYYDLYEIPLEVLGYFDVAEHGDPYALGGLAKESVFDRLASSGVPFEVWTYRTPERENFEALRDSIDSASRVLFLYTAELDALMHRVGTTHDSVREKLAEYEGWMESLIEAAASSGRETTFFLFSDHGMTDVTEVVDLRRRIDEWGYHFGRDFVAFYDSTMARFWCSRDGRTELTGRLDDTGWGRVLREDELEALGCRFTDNSYGDVIFLVKPGYLIVPSFMGRERLAAMHGYHPQHPSSLGCFYTTASKGGMPSSIVDLKALLVGHVLEEA